MTVRVRERKGRPGFQMDILLRLPDGTRHRERLQAPVSTRSSALRWGQQREGEIIANGGRTQKAPVGPPAPTLAEFWPRFLEGHSVANRDKPSNLYSKRHMRARGRPRRRCESRAGGARAGAPRVLQIRIGMMTAVKCSGTTSTRCSAGSAWTPSPTRTSSA